MTAPRYHTVLILSRLPAIYSPSAEPPMPVPADDLGADLEPEIASRVTPGELRRLMESPAADAISASRDCISMILAWAGAVRFVRSADAPTQARVLAHWRHALAPAMLSTLATYLEVDKPYTAKLHESVTAACAAALADPSAPPNLRSMAAALYFELLEHLPTLVRHWWSHDVRSRGTHAALAKFTEAHVSPSLLTRTLRAIEEGIGAGGGDDFRVKVSLASRQVTAMHACDGSTMQVVLQLSSCYPLKPIEVECVQRVGVSDAKWRKWQRTMTTMLLSRNGAIADALLLFRDNVNAVFDGVEECPICYAIVHQTTRQIPKLECKTCHNKFHAPCLYKWFNSSQKNTCPLCQQPIGHARE